MTFNGPTRSIGLPAADAPAWEAWRLRRSDIPALILVFSAYTVTAALGLQWTVIQGVGAVIWPAAGVALASLLLGGVKLWPAVLLGRLAAAAITASPLPWSSTLVIAIGATAGAAIPALLIRLRTRFDPQLMTLTDLLWLAVAGAFFGGLLSAATGGMAWAMAGQAPSALGPAVVTWILGYAAGALTTAPLILVWSHRDAWRQSPRAWLHYALCMAVSGVLIWSIFLRPEGALRTWHVFPALIWAAVAFNARGVSLQLTVIAVAALVGAAHGMGPFGGRFTDGERILVTQQFVLITSATMLVLAAVADERRAKRKLERALARNIELYAAAEHEIAERLRAERHQALLINELNHRVKNTLATVQSMVGQTLRATESPQEALDALTARIVALASAHNVLNRENWEAADLGDVVAAAMAPFDAAGAPRVRCEGPPVRLNPSLSLALAMAFHELGTNAVKYGALSVPSGEVHVDWGCFGEAGERRLEVSWREHGGPPVRPPERQGFGWRLLVRALPQQLHGSVQLEFAPEGLRCDITALLQDLHPAPKIGAH